MLNEKREIDGTLYVFDKIIPSNALHGRMVKEIIAPNAVLIEEEAIYRCPHLIKITAKNLQKIGENIVEECPSLVEVEAPLLEQQHIHFMGSLFIDLDKRKILNVGNFEPRFVRVLNEELSKGEHLEIIEKQDGSRVLKLDENEILKEKNGKIRGICLPTALKLPSHALYDNDFVEELVLLSATKIDHNAIYKASALKKVVGSKVQHIRFSNFTRCPQLIETILPELISVEDGCFCYNDKFSNFSFDKLESVGKNCFCFLPKVGVFSLKNAVAIGESSLQYNENMRVVLLPELEELERGLLYKCGVEYLYAPKIKERAVRIKYLKNAKQLIKKKDVLLPEYKGMVKE